MLLIDSKPLISRYRLKSRGFMNAISNRREFEGALIQIDGGFGCIHPWPELGDPTLEKCLADLAGARRWPIVRRAIRCAEYDRAAREYDGSLFEEMEVPLSHATLAKGDAAEIALAVEAGFTTVKLKAGRDLAAEKKLLEAMSAEFPTLRWRIDFNESMELEAVTEFLLALSEKTRAAIDFVEDPCPFSESGWSALYQKTRIQLAVDREATTTSAAAQVMVIKPAVDEPFLLGEAAISHNQRVVLTSYMDHPVARPLRRGKRRGWNCSFRASSESADCKRTSFSNRTNSPKHSGRGRRSSKRPTASVSASTIFSLRNHGPVFTDKTCFLERHDAGGDGGSCRSFRTEIPRAF
jgi:O-succinylbenzoate synthase